MPSIPSLLPPPRGTSLAVPAETMVETRIGWTVEVAVGGWEVREKEKK